MVKEETQMGHYMVKHNFLHYHTLYLTALYFSNQSAFAAKILTSYNFTLKPNLGHFSRFGKLLAHLNIYQYELPDLKECPFLGFNHMGIYIDTVAAIAV